MLAPRKPWVIENGTACSQSITEHAVLRFNLRVSIVCSVAPDSCAISLLRVQICNLAIAAGQRG